MRSTTLTRPRAPRSAAAPILGSLPRPSGRTTLIVAAVVAVLVVLALWVRDSALVAVDRVVVLGATGPDAARVRTALETAGRDMTTLHVREDQLRTAVEPFPSVASIEVQADFPHELKVVVHQHDAVAVLVTGEQRIAVAGDGTLLRGSRTAGLPTIEAPNAVAGDTLRDARARSAVAVLAAAPNELRAKVRRVYVGPRGLTAPLQAGPVLYFGDSARLDAKWIAATRVLADPSSAGATYLDLRLPESPAAGGLEQATMQPAGAAATTASNPAAATGADPVATGDQGTPQG